MDYSEEFKLKNGKVVIIRRITSTNKILFTRRKGNKMTSRTNIKLVPSAQTIAKITDLLRLHNLPYQDFAADPHCTIIYSRDVVEVKKIKLPVTDFPIVGKNARFALFYTKDDGIVLVVEFECEAAKNCFEYMKKTYNLSTRYDEYRAHITMQKNLADKNIKLPNIDFDLSFDKIEADNGN